jgi:AraC-like DNA-binding protein
MRASLARTLFQTERLRLGEFRCPPGHRRWSERNWIGDSFHVVFPHTSVVIAQVGREPIVSTPNHVVVYNADTYYERTLLQPREGDRSIFVSVADELLDEILGSLGRSRGHTRAAVPLTQVLVDDVLYLEHHLLTAAVLARIPASRAIVEERLAALVRRTLAAGFERAATLRESNGRGQRRLVEEAKARLATRPHRPPSITQLALELHVSPYHLARIFKEWTGVTLHTFTQRLRLRTALDRIADPSTNLSRLALELGFSSHSHFTDTFRRSFGIPPSALRGSEVRRIAEASAHCPP